MRRNVLRAGRCLTMLGLLALAGCDYHQSFRPSSPRGISQSDVDVQLSRVGDDHMTFSVRFHVLNSSTHAIVFHPSLAPLVIGNVTESALTGTITNPHDGADEAVDAISAGQNAAKIGGARGGIATAATSLMLDSLDGPIMLGIDQAARGPYTSRDQILGPGKDAFYTLQFPLHVEGDTFFVDRAPTANDPTDSTQLPLSLGCALVLHDAFSTSNGEALAMNDLQLLDATAPHFGFDPPEPPGAVFLVRLGAGPGFGHVSGVGGLEIAAGPRWEKTALAFSGQLGPGFPLAIDARYELVDRAAWSLTTTVGDALWVFPEAATAPRVGTELAMKWGAIDGYGNDFAKAGVYARGGPVFFRDGKSGGALELGFVVGAF